MARPGAVEGPAVLAVVGRDRAREALRRSFGRRHGVLTLVRSADECAEALRARFTDAVIVDVGQPGEAMWAAAAIASQFPSIPFFAYGPCRPNDAAVAARLCGPLEFADMLMEGVDDGVHRELVRAASFTRRLDEALAPVAAQVGLSTPLHQRVWAEIVARGGRPVRTTALADAVGLTREHLSRRFAAGGAPNLKRIIDLVRLLASAELAKNVGYDLPDIARVLGFASPSHLSVASKRVFGIRSLSLARLRPHDLIERFLRHGTRSRAGGGVALDGGL